MIVLLAVSLQRYGSTSAPRPVTELSGSTMGTTWSVKVSSAQLADGDFERLDAAVRARLAAIDDLMSTWKSDSELSRFNASDGGSAFPVAPETLAVFRIAREVSELSGGAFDVTVGPLVDAWGFGPAISGSAPPPPSQLAELLSSVGYEQIEIDSQASTLRKPAGVRCDLSAVAKGFAVDEISRLLGELGHQDHLVEIGGELRARGAHADGRAWRVAIEMPEPGGRGIHRVVELTDLGMATSGDYRNYYEIDGRRVSHTIDPRTGHPIDHRLASVTVVHEETARADALATALNVLGPAEGWTLARSLGLRAHFIVRNADGSFEGRTTPELEPLLLPALSR